MNARRLIGAFMLITTALVVRTYTAYFGNNWLPGSPAEAVCDLLALVAFGIAFILILTPDKK